MGLDAQLETLKKRRLIVVTGKGGVGKSLLTVTLGQKLARAGRRTLVLEVDPRENLHPLLGTPPSGGEVRAAGERLYLQNLKPKEVADWVVRKQVKIDLLAKRVLESPVYHRFVDGAPGLREMAILGHALRLLRGETSKAPRLDTVVLDAPATGHGVYLLTAARLYAETIGQGPFAGFAREIADFSGDPEQTSVVVVTLAEEMPVQEAIELRESLIEKHGREPELLVVNGLYPPVPDFDEPPATVEPTDAVDQASMLALWRRRRAVNERELERLAAEWPAESLQLPLLPMEPGPPLVDALVDLVDAAGGGR
ncbi:MAG: ArsA family ATPase [Acidobacteriota bacterium]